MQLNDEKVKKLEELDSDYSRLILKMNKYLNAEHSLNSDIEFIDANDKDSISNALNSTPKSIIISLNYDFNQVLSEICDNYTEKITVIIDIDLVSLYPIWNTRMRRKAEYVVNIVNDLNNFQITDKKLYNILFKTKQNTVVEDTLLKIEDVLNVSSQEAGDNACKIEHIISENILSRMEKFSKFFRKHKKILEIYIEESEK